MLKENINVDVDFEVLPFAQHLENLEMGHAEFWRAAWVADYPDPENFLNLLYGTYVPKNITEKSYINSIRYSSVAFDSVFSYARREKDEMKRMELFRKADQVAMDDAAIMPVFYDEYTSLVQGNIAGYYPNAMNYQDLSRVYIVPDTKASRSK
jgi:ABC-type oligopeptide transport system substrate-binding subunit